MITAQHGDATNWIEEWLFQLTDRHREVICRRFGLLGHEATTLRDISEQIGLTRERIRQIQSFLHSDRQEACQFLFFGMLYLIIVLLLLFLL